MATTTDSRELLDRVCRVPATRTPVCGARTAALRRGGQYDDAAGRRNERRVGGNTPRTARANAPTTGVTRP